jgi:acetoin utilization protein AcuB
MQVRDWMSSDPVTVSVDDTVSEARRLLDTEGVRHLPVVDDTRLVGILSDRDVAIREAALRQAVLRNDIATLLDDERPVEAVMSSDVHTVGADVPIAEAARTLVSRRINALPVVEDGRLVGILTSTDCLLATLDDVSGGVAAG